MWLAQIFLLGTVVGAGFWGLPGTAAQALFQEPIVASAAAYLLLGVILTAAQYLGGALIILAVVLLASRKVEEITHSHFELKGTGEAHPVKSSGTMIGLRDLANRGVPNSRTL